MTELLPWQKNQWRRLQQAVAAERLPHALLFSGGEGIGKDVFAVLLARALLCRSPGDDGLPCGKCRACRFHAAGTHPDFLRIEPEGDGKPIRVDAIRDFSAWSVLTPQEGARRVTIISPADSMNAAAANSLLKTLEEPVRGNYILLVTSRAAALPATVRSRCQTVAFGTPDAIEAQSWLAEQHGEGPWELLLRVARGAPLRALELAADHALDARSACFAEFDLACRGRTDPLELVTTWTRPGSETDRILGWAVSWLRDMVRLRYLAGPEVLENPDLAPALQSLGEQLDLRVILEVQDRLLTGSQGWRQANLNVPMQLEDLIFALVESYQ